MQNYNKFEAKGLTKAQIQVIMKLTHNSTYTIYKCNLESIYSSSVIQYYTDRIQGCLKEPFTAFKAARLFVPQKIRELQPDANTVDSLVAFPFLNNPTVLDHLKQELPQYIALTEDLSSAISQ